jgi:hypothetical protein
LKNTVGEEVHLFPDFLRRAIISVSKDIHSYALICIRENEFELFVDGDSEQYELAKNSILNLLNSFDIQDTIINRITSTKVDKGNKLRRIRNENR